MATKQPKAAPKEPQKAATIQDEIDASEAVKITYRLENNAGLIIDGKANKHFAAGTEFDAIADKATIEALVRSGVQLTEV